MDTHKKAELGRIKAQIRSHLAEKHSMLIDITSDGQPIAQDIVSEVIDVVSDTLGIRVPKQIGSLKGQTVGSLSKFIYENQSEPPPATVSTETPP